jgi:hypothetical protein
MAGQWRNISRLPPATGKQDTKPCSPIAELRGNCRIAVWLGRLLNYVCQNDTDDPQHQHNKKYFQHTEFNFAKPYLRLIIGKTEFCGFVAPEVKQQYYQTASQSNEADISNCARKYC